MSDRMLRARDAWKDVPDWLEVLIVACDKPGSSQAKVAKALGRTPGVVSAAINNKYPGDMADFEDRVRSVLVPEDVKCPAIGWISTGDCLGWRDEAADLKTGPMHVRMYRACHECPRFQKTEEEDDG